MKILLDGKIIEVIRLETGTVVKGNTITFTAGAFSNLDDNHTYQIESAGKLFNIQITSTMQKIATDLITKTLFEAIII